MSVEKRQFFNFREGERKLVFSLMGILVVSALVLELADVIATGGFVSKIGPRNIVWLWIVDMLITITTAGIYALAVDRTERIKLVQGLLLGFAVLFFGLRFLFEISNLDWLTYPILYILTDQLYAIFPLAFWALANDLYTSAEGKRLFPIIAMGTIIGSVIGNGLAAASGWILEVTGGDSPSLLMLGAVMLLVGFLLVRLTLVGRKIKARQARETDFDIRETITVGLDYVRNVPLFKFLAISMLFSGLAFAILEYHFLFSIDAQVANDPLQFQAFYGTFKVIVIISTLLVQALFTSKFLEKIGLKNSFIVQPIALGIGSLIAMFIPGIYGAAGARYVIRLVQQSWDEPARKSLENLVPDERRGRVSVMIDRYLYDFSTIVGALVLGALLFLSNIWLSAIQVIWIYLGLTLLASFVAIFSATRLRKTYDESLLDWRLSRSRRKSVLDGIEF